MHYGDYFYETRTNQSTKRLVNKEDGAQPRKTIMIPKELKTEMFRIMRANLGIGLSANQVGIDGRVFVFYNNNTNNHLERDMMCINPEIIEDKGEPVSMFEGCQVFPWSYYSGY